jgi:hypothetical protein
MAQLPVGAKKDVFSLSFDGVYGRFKTAESFELGYLLTTLKAHELQNLETASKAFDFRSITFDEIIQRDIDMERVDNELVRDYLEKGANKVLFFPPILVSIVAVENGKRIDTYKSVDTTPPTDNFPFITRTWDKDKFQLELNRSDTPTGYTIDVGEDKYNYIPYAATVRVNPQTVKLVVIDGQHRFMALRRIMENTEKKHLLNEMGIPVCVFFTPDAVGNSGHVESINRDLRELFVTINSTAKEVSGHFIILLNDKSLSSLTLRTLANDWKTSENPQLLPLLEWNTREASKARQRQKPFSLTTVTAVADCLEKYVFNRPEVVEDLLNLSAIREDLKVAPNSPAYNEISEDVFGPEQIEILRERLAGWVTPSLNALFLTPRPYAALVASYKVALKALDEKVQQNTPGALSYREDVLFQFRRTAKNDYDSVKTAETEFESKIVISESDSVFFLNVFQQGLIRAWATFSKSLVKLLETKPETVAKAMVCVLELRLFNPSKQFLDRAHSYIQPLLYEGDKLRVNESTRTQWQNLILSCFYTQEAKVVMRKSLIQTLGNNEGVDKAIEIIAARAKEALVEYLQSHKERIRDDYSKNWRFKELDSEVMRYLRERDGNDGLKSEFDDKIDQLVFEKCKQARTALSNVLGIAEDQLPSA